MPYTPQTWADLPSTSTPITQARLGTMETGIRLGAANVLNPTATKTSAYTALAGDLVVCDTSSGAFTVTLPAAVAGTVIGINKADTSANAVTVSAAGTDTIGVVGATTTTTLPLTGAIALIGISGGWAISVTGSTVSALDTRYTALGICRTPYAVQVTALITIGTANSSWYYRVFDGAPISKIRVQIGTSSGNISVATYSNSGAGLSAIPGTRLATSGSVASPGTGIQDVSLGATVTVNPGDWLAIAADNTTATFSGITGVGGSTLLSGMTYNQLTAFPCPSTPTSLIAGNNRLIGLVGVP